MTYRIPLALPDLRGNELNYVTNCVTTRRLTQGDTVAAFEHAFAQRLGVKHAVACSSGTAALHLALLAYGVRYGDKVLVPTMTYVAAVAAVLYCKAIPVFADVDPETWGLGGNYVGEHDIALPVHLYGVPCVTHPSDIEDAAEALGANLGPRPTPAGTYGRMGVFSFYGNKILTTGEGGMVVTDDPSLAEKLRLYRGQGQDPTRRYWHTVVGYNYRMTEIAAAIGLAQLERLDDMLHRRHQLLARYMTTLYDLPLQWQQERSGTTRAPWVVACLLPKTALCGSGDYSYPYFRDLVMKDLARQGIETRPTFPCVHEMPPYRGFASYPPPLSEISTRILNGTDPQVAFKTPGLQRFPVAEDIAARGILLPLHSQMALSEVDDVCASLRRLL